MAAPAICFSATHYLALDEVKRWLAEHGADITDVIDVTIRFEACDNGQHGHAVDDRIAAWADLRWYKGEARDKAAMPPGDGAYRYFEPHTSEDAATGHSTIPLRSFPKLTPAD